ncbi:MAG: PAS domain S-box protein [FCB group bacterium]|nr:PAS domain S-box protein [FCB group bacterium]
MPRILFIDDHQETLTTLKSIIRKEFQDVKLVSANSGEDGLAYVSETIPDIIILNVALPGIDGFEVCRRLRANPATTAIPIIILTGVHLSSRDKIEGLHAGADVYLSKPVEPGELVSQVRAMLRIKLAEDQIRKYQNNIENKVREQSKQVLENEFRFRLLYDNLSVGLYRTTLDGKILLANQAMIDLLGYSSFADFAKRNLNTEGYEPGYDRSIFIERLRQEGHIQGNEVTWTRKNGTRIYIRENAYLVRDQSGDIVYIEGTIEDITREKESRLALQEERQLFRSGPMVIFRWLAGDERIPINYVSPNVESLYGYSVQQLIQGELHYSDIIHPDDLERVVAEVQEHVLAGETHFSQRYRILDAQGDSRWVHDLTTVVRDKQGQVTSYIGYITDITAMVSLSKELEQKDRIIRNVLKQALEGIMVTDETGNIVEWSQGMEEITGVSADEVLGQPAWEIQAGFADHDRVSKDQVTNLENLITTILETGEVPDIYQLILIPIKRKNGEKRVIQQVLSTYKTESGYGLIGFLLDETKAVQTARELEETQKRYETLFQASPDGFILEDSHGNILDCNPASCEILGYSRDEMIGMNVVEIADSESKSEVRSNIQTILETGYLSHEVENQRGDGTWITLELHEVKVPLPNGEDGILVIHRDVTERKRVEKELRKRDRILSVITNAAEEVLRAQSWFDCVESILANIGQAVGATRVTLFENQKSESDLLFAKVWGRWAARGFARKHRKTARSFKDLGFEPWSSQLNNGEKITARISETKNQSYFEINKSKSVLIIPILAGSEWWGILSFDDHRSERRWSEMEVESLTIAANLLGTSIQRDISDAALRRLAESVSTTPEETFFESLVLELNEVLGCDFAFVGELNAQDPGQIQTIAFVQDGELKPNFIFNMKETPCENVVGKEYCQCVEDVRRKFPRDTFLQEWEIDSFYGMPLFAGGNNQLGIIAVMSRQTIKNEHLVESLLKVFADRAGSELERRRAYEKLRESEEKFRLSFKTSPDAVNINRLSDGLYVEINDGFTALTGYTWDDVQGKTSVELKIWADLEDRKKLVRALRKDGIVENLEARFRFRDGSLHTGLMSARVITMHNEPHILSITRDIEDRKQAELLVIESETRYRKLVDQAPVAIGIHAQGVWRFINAEGVRLMGFEHYNELIGQPVLNIMHPDSRELALKRIQHMMKTGEPLPLIEEKLLRRDGATVYALVTSTPIQFKGEQAYQVIAMDITALKVAESEIQILNEAVEQSPSTVMITDLEGNIEYVNPKFSEVTGWSSDEVIGENANLLKSGHTSAKEYEQMWKTITDGKTWYGEFHNKRKDGSLYWEQASISPVVDSEGVVQHFLAVKEDITEKKETRARLEESEAKFRSIFEESLDTIYLGTVDGRILDINPAGEALFGYTRKELLKMDARRFYRGSGDRETFVGRIQKDGYVRDYKLTLRKKDGSEMICLVNAKVIGAREDGTQVISGLIHDITKQEKDRFRLQEALKKAQEGERVKTLFLANMSHEIRTPLNSVLGFVELLRKDDSIESPEERNEVIDIIQASGQRLMRTVHEILDISQIEAGTFSLNPEDLDLNEIINQVVKEHNATIKMRGLELINLSEVRKPVIHADRESILKAISNLVDNAIKYTPSGTIHIHLKSERGQFILTIKDTGIGISKEYMKHMYDVFSQESSGFTKKYQGLGLGLSITKRCLDMNSVPVTVESQKDVGTTFTLEFTPAQPVSKQGIGVAEGSGKEDPASEGILGDVLVVEDDPSSQLLMEYFLKSRYQLYYAVSVQEAKEVLRKIKPQVVLLDLSLAGNEDGLNLVRVMRKKKKWSTIPVIALTAHVFVTDRDRCLKAGCNDYLSKPVRQSVLLDKIRRLNVEED